jgi:hypothetical protein
MPIQLSEREIGYDLSNIGFPSIGACRGIVLVTAGGLFGLPLNGTSTPQKEQNFVQFVAGHPQGGAAAKRNLYIASRVGGDSQHRNAAECYAEIKGYAAALGYRGSIYWADLSSLGGSAYVYFDSVQNNTCVVSTRPWNDTVDRVPGNKSPYAVGANRAMALGGAPAQVYNNNLSQAGLQVIYPTQVP